MASVASVEALTDSGLSGDRYADSKNRRAPDYQVTLIELENIQAFVATTGLALAPEQPRRNIVTRGVSLNSLRGKRFKIGAAAFEGLELCEPCSLFATRTHREVLRFFVGKVALGQESSQVATSTSVIESSAASRLRRRCQEFRTECNRAGGT